MNKKVEQLEKTCTMEMLQTKRQEASRYTTCTKAEQHLWRIVIQKVVVHHGHLLEFHILDDAVILYQMYRILPRMCKLSKAVQEKVRLVYSAGEPIASITQRFDIPGVCGVLLQKK